MFINLNPTKIEIYYSQSVLNVSLILSARYLVWRGFYPLAFFPMINIFNKLCGLHLLAYILVLVGALNW